MQLALAGTKVCLVAFLLSTGPVAAGPTRTSAAAFRRATSPTMTAAMAGHRAIEVGERPAVDGPTVDRRATKVETTLRITDRGLELAHRPVFADTGERAGSPSREAVRTADQVDGFRQPQSATGQLGRPVSRASLDRAVTGALGETPAQRATARRQLGRRLAVFASRSERPEVGAERSLAVRTAPFNGRLTAYRETVVATARGLYIESTIVAAGGIDLTPDHHTRRRVTAAQVRRLATQGSPFVALPDLERRAR